MFINNDHYFVNGDHVNDIGGKIISNHLSKEIISLSGFAILIPSAPEIS